MKYDDDDEYPTIPHDYLGQPITLKELAIIVVYLAAILSVLFFVVAR